MIMLRRGSQPKLLLLLSSFAPDKKKRCCKVTEKQDFLTLCIGNSKNIVKLEVGMSTVLNFKSQGDVTREDAQ